MVALVRHYTRFSKNAENESDNKKHFFKRQECEPKKRGERARIIRKLSACDGSVVKPT